MRFSSYAGRARGPPLLVGKDTCIRSGPASRSDSFDVPICTLCVLKVSGSSNAVPKLKYGGKECKGASP